MLVAHPDDEIVAGAAAVMRARAAGAEVAACYLTHGCIARDTVWPWQRKYYDVAVAMRRAEGEAVAAQMGVTPLGWADRPARHLWQHLPQVMEEAAAAVAAWRPDQVWVPAYEGGNPDHDALNAVGFALKKRVSVLEFAEYNYFGGHARSQQFISPDETTRTIDLTEDERRAKRALLGVYASERGNLSYVKCDRESYRPIATYDYFQPPHQGTLWYARFQWVPFRHPRVDFTDPAAVSAAITAFLSRQ